MHESQLSEIALECGFSSQAHLTAVFGKAYGVTRGYLQHKIVRMKTKKTTSKSLIPVWLLKVGSSRCIFQNSCNPVFKLYPLQPVVHRLGGNPEKENC